MKTATVHVPSILFRLPECILERREPSPAEKRTGEFTGADEEAREALDALEKQLGEFEPIRQKLGHFIMRERAALERKRPRGFFKLVNTKDHQRGQGFVAHCMIEDWMQALLIAVDENPETYPPSSSCYRFLDPTPERRRQARASLADFDEATIQHAAIMFAKGINDPKGLAETMRACVDIFFDQCPAIYDQLLWEHKKGWRKRLRECLVRQLKTARKGLQTGKPQDGSDKGGKQEQPAVRSAATPAEAKPASAAAAPQPKAAPAPKPAAAPAAGGKEQAAPTTEPLCHCGCGEQTRGGEFAPGHDMKHKARLRARAQNGTEQERREARTELNRRGWGLVAAKKKKR